MKQSRQLQSTRYSATIKFSKVEVYKDTDYNGRVKDDAEPVREVTETQVTVRAASLHKLQEKVTAHVALLDDQDLTDTDDD